ncbi:MAG: 2-oxoacid:ferredoxin oxidoreductase subunit beta [Bacillota bacterium]
MPDLQTYFRTQHMPTIWCAGCGHGIVLGAVLRAIDRLGLDKDNVAIVSGIGCASRAPGYLDFNTLHTTHGRALAFATGLKMARPDLKVIVVTGDGDLAAIGGNHFLHAARRNVDITTVCFNNEIYGMTSGQYSPMTPTTRVATTAPYGNLERNFDLCELAKAAGATFVARGAAFYARALSGYIEQAIKHKGFSLVEAVSQCPTYYGRRNKLGAGPDMLEWQRTHAVTGEKAAGLSREEMADRFVIGKFYEAEAPEYVEEYGKLIERLKGGR